MLYHWVSGTHRSMLYQSHGQCTFLWAEENKKKIGLTERMYVKLIYFGWMELCMDQFGIEHALSSMKWWDSQRSQPASWLIFMERDEVYQNQRVWNTQMRTRKVIQKCPFLLGDGHAPFPLFLIIFGIIWLFSHAFAFAVGLQELGRGGRYMIYDLKKFLKQSHSTITHCYNSTKLISFSLRSNSDFMQSRLLKRGMCSLSFGHAA